MSVCNLEMLENRRWNNLCRYF